MNYLKASNSNIKNLKCFFILLHLRTFSPNSAVSIYELQGA